MGSHEYEEYIEDRIENVLNDLMYVPKVRESAEFHDDMTPNRSNYFRDNLKDLLSHMMDSNELKIEPRIRALEQILFKTTQQDRNQFFEHIYEKIRNAESTLKIEIDRLDQKVHWFEKRTD